MQVLLVSPFPPNRTGPAQYGEAFAREMTRKGHQVTVLAEFVRSGVEPPTPGFQVIRSWRKGRGHARDVLRAASSRTWDVAHVNYTFTMYGGAFALPSSVRMMKGLARRGPVVVTLFDVLPKSEVTRETLDLYEVHVPASFVWWGMRRTLRAITQNVARLVVQNSVVKEILQTDYGIPPQKIVVTPLPDGPVDGATPSGTPTRVALPVPGPRTILFFGYLAPYKGIEPLLEAFVAAKGAVPSGSLKLVVAGETHPRLRYDYRRQLEELARSKGLGPEEVTFPGYVEDEESTRLFATSHLVALPYLKTAGISGTLSSAIGLARPVMVSALPHLLAQLDGYPASRVVNPGDVGAMTETLVQVAKDAFQPQPRPPGGVRVTANWGTLADQTESMYRAVTAEGRQGAT